MSYAPAQLIAPRSPIIEIDSLGSLEAIGGELNASNAGMNTALSNNWPAAANVALFVPFGVAQAITAVKMWVQNGTAVAGNIDMGIFDAAGTMLVHKGSTAQAGISGIQELDITDTLLAPGRYYMGISSDTSGVTSKTFQGVMGGAYLAVFTGCYQVAATFPLATVTYAAYASVRVPWFGLAARTLVA